MVSTSIARASRRPDVVGTIAVMRAQGGQCSSVSPVARAVEDRELVARLMTGEQRALADIYDRYAGLVYGIARRVLCDDGRAEDVTQEVFVYLWEQPQRFDAACGSLRSWLGLLAHRRSVDRVRADVRHANGEARLRPGAPAATETEIDDALSGAWLSDRVRDALDQLPPEQRDAIVLAFFGKRTYRQVATELAIPEGTA